MFVRSIPLMPDIDARCAGLCRCLPCWVSFRWKCLEGFWIAWKLPNL